MSGRRSARLQAAATKAPPAAKPPPKRTAKHKPPKSKEAPKRSKTGHTPSSGANPTPTVGAILKCEMVEEGLSRIADVCTRLPEGSPAGRVHELQDNRNGGNSSRSAAIRLSNGRSLSNDRGRSEGNSFGLPRTRVRRQMWWSITITWSFENPCSTTSAALSLLKQAARPRPTASAYGASVPLYLRPRR